MIGFTVLAFQVVLWKGQDISVDIVSETEEGSNEVTISVRNTAGSTLLFYESDEMTGKIEYLSEDGWVEYCDLSYTSGNASAVSKLYGETFAELEPGENWQVTVPADKVAGMKNGTYRIKMTYITEKRYNKYLDEQSESTNDESEEESLDISIDESAEDIGNDSEESNEITSENTIDNIIQPIIGTDNVDNDEVSFVEEYIAEAESEVFIKTFEYESAEDFVSEISFEKRTIDNADEKIESEIVSKKE